MRTATVAAQEWVSLCVENAFFLGDFPWATFVRTVQEIKPPVHGSLHDREAPALPQTKQLENAEYRTHFAPVSMSREKNDLESSCLKPTLIRV